jgi:para-aminobenzoate synthetase component I
MRQTFEKRSWDWSQARACPSYRQKARCVLILCEDGPDGRPVVFNDARQVVIAWQWSEVLPALRLLEEARKAGAWIAGYMSYEAGYVFEERFAPLRTGSMTTPLLAFGIYAAPKDAVPILNQANPRDAVITAPEPLITRSDYDRAIAKVLDYIRAGDCYQINLTFPMRARLISGDAFALYGALRARQKVGHGAFVNLGEGPILVSRSPDLFLRCDREGRIEARPMKGTAPRDPDPVADAERAQELRASAKGQAENLMIVDLLRNDIARIAKVGSVKVPQLFAIETYATLHQMVSRIVGKLQNPANLPDLLAALFPCGSITGAPKMRAMQIIAELEPFARGAYCGTIGWMAPDGAASFSVAIRTLMLRGDEITLNVGGGIVQDSTADGEWEEALWKARYVNGLVSKISN